ncbi:rhodanese-like domain-containing protein [Arsukibacterium sp.]|uniref:rhodanese-like domain-containing protein n=1 Tax=Arsukibacterium sp. TaxID=1977258 RepID=UPI00299F2B6A|nr:rhodanese-like domain-containing protein [Arsukibacterium sp.]MDX1676808.1 rhodanese-like domain-containing protein [Arsukibacterium sp.]
MKKVTKADIKRLNEIEEADFVLINVLPKDAFNKKHIRTSINIPFPENDDFVTDVAEVVGENKNHKIIVYCANKECDASPNAAKTLEKAGFTQVYDYEGGMADWEGKKQAA